MRRRRLRAILLAPRGGTRLRKALQFLSLLIGDPRCCPTSLSCHRTLQAFICLEAKDRTKDTLRKCFHRVPRSRPYGLRGLIASLRSYRQGVGTYSDWRLRRMLWYKLRQVEDTRTNAYSAVVALAFAMRATNSPPPKDASRIKSFLQFESSGNHQVDFCTQSRCVLAHAKVRAVDLALGLESDGVLLVDGIHTGTH